jgi:hypothetical protein
LFYYATSSKFTSSIPDEIIGFFNWPNSSSRIIALGSTQRLTKRSSRNLPVAKERPVLKADNLTAICGKFLYKYVCIQEVC